jgi:hypothetical protein
MIKRNILDWLHALLSCSKLSFVVIRKFLFRLRNHLNRCSLGFVLLNSLCFFCKCCFLLVSDILLTLVSLIISYVILLHLDYLSIRLCLVTGISIERLRLLLQLFSLCTIFVYYIRVELLIGNLIKTKTQ